MGGFAWTGGMFRRANRLLVMWGVIERSLQWVRRDIEDYMLRDDAAGVNWKFISDSVGGVPTLTDAFELIQGVRETVLSRPEEFMMGLYRAATVAWIRDIRPWLIENWPRAGVQNG